MRTSKPTILFVLLCSLCIAITSTADAQIVGKLLKRTAKKSLKTAIVEKTTKEIAEDIAVKAVGKEFGEDIATRVLAREAAQNSIKRGAKREATQRLTGEVLESNADNILIKSLGREAAEHGVSRIAHSATTEITQRVTSKSIAESSQRAVQKAIKKSSEQATKRVVLDAGQQALESQLKDIVGSGANKVLRDKCSKESLEHCSKQLLKDVAADPALAQHIKRNPQFVNSYLQAIDAPSVRTDIKMLRYLHNGADKFVDAGYLKKWGKGADLIFKEQNGVCKIFDTNSDFLGEIVKTTDNKIVIHCSAKNRKLLNLYPISNATYICDNHKWTTDRYGRVCQAYYTVTGREKILAREAGKSITTSVRDLKNRHNRLGLMTSNKLPLADDGGHLIPRSAGGTNDAINIIPQNQKSNRGGVWKQCENAATSKKAAKMGKSINCKIDLYYNDDMSLRPSSASRTHTIDGQAQRLKNGVTIQNCTIDNPIE